MANINRIQLELILETCSQSAELTGKQIKSVLTIIASSQLSMFDQLDKAKLHATVPEKQPKQPLYEQDKQREKQVDKQMFLVKPVKQQFCIGQQIPTKAKQKQETYDQLNKQIGELGKKLENRINRIEQKVSHLGEIQKNLSHKGAEKQIFPFKTVKQQFVIGQQIPTKSKETYDHLKKEVLELGNKLENRIGNIQQKTNHLSEIQKNISLIVTQNLDLKQSTNSKIANFMLQINQQNKKLNNFNQLISKLDSNSKIMEDKMKDCDNLIKNVKQNVKQDIAKLLMRDVDNQINHQLPKHLPKVLENEINGNAFKDKMHQIFVDHMSFHIDQVQSNLKSIDYEIWKIKYSLKQLQQKLTQRLYENSFNQQGSSQKNMEGVGIKKGLSLNPHLQAFMFNNQFNDYQQRARARKQQQGIKEKEKIQRYKRIFPNQPIENFIQMEKFTEQLQKRTRFLNQQKMMMGMPYQQQSSIKISSEQDIVQQDAFSQEQQIDAQGINLYEKKVVIKKKKNKNIIKIEDWIDNTSFYYRILKKHGSLLSSKCQCYGFGNRISGQIWRFKVRFTKKQPNIGVGISDSSYRLERVIHNHPSYYQYRTNGVVYRGGIQKTITPLRPFNKGQQLQIQVNIKERTVSWRTDNTNIHTEKWTHSQFNNVIWVPFIHFYAKDSIRIIK